MAEEVDLVSAKELNLRVFQGDSLAYVLTFTDASNNPISFLGTLVEFWTLPAPGFTMSNAAGAGIVISGAGNNVMTFNKDVNLPKGIYEYRLRVRFSDNRKLTFHYGKLNVVEGENG